MCGIIGYVGRENATPILLEGLRRLEYRGYDSAGIAVAGKNGVRVERSEGKLGMLEGILANTSIEGMMGIGHTRWATHGRPSEINAHPHRAGDVIVVHNGIIENYTELKRCLIEAGRVFTSETDTEVISHLVDYHLCKNGGKMREAVSSAVNELSGSYALVIINVNETDRLYVAKNGSPLVVGATSDARLVASDIPALLPYTKEMMFLEDGDFAVLSMDGVRIFDSVGNSAVRNSQHIPWTPLMAEKGGYKHFMLKEIFEQPTILQDVLTGRITKDRSSVNLEELASIFPQGRPCFDKIIITACGTSLHAAKLGKYMIESIARVSVSVDYASEFRYRDPILDERTLIVPISQSGETADTLAAEKMARDMGCPIMAICNSVGSSISRIADATLYIHAGPEIGVASTKAFTAQLLSLYLFALYLADKLGRIEKQELQKHIMEIASVPRLVEETLKGAAAVQAIAETICDAQNVLYIGRGLNYPVALEGALKLKEISYLHAEGFPAGELKHGPIALVDHGVPVIAIAPRDGTYEKVLSNLEEVKARGAYTVAVAEEGDVFISGRVDAVMKIPASGKFTTPIVASVPLQLLAYYAADHKGTDVDQPRNLAKSVTVE